MHVQLNDRELNLCIRAVAAQPAELLAAVGTQRLVPVESWKLQSENRSALYLMFVDTKRLLSGQEYATWIVDRKEGSESGYRVNFFSTRIRENGSDYDTIPPPHAVLSGALSPMPWMDDTCKDQSLSCLVLRCADLDLSRTFYAALGLDPESEQHGGPRHFSIQLGATVLELYSAGNAPSAPIRLGLAKPISPKALLAVERCGGSVVREARDSQGRTAVVRDPDQNLIDVRVA